MCDVLQLQPAGAFLRAARSFRSSDAVHQFSNPIAVIGSCTDIDVALRLDLDQDDVKTEPSKACCLRKQSQLDDEPLDFLTTIRRGLEDLVVEVSDDECDDDDDEDEASSYYQASTENTYYSPNQKHPFCSGLMDDATDLSDTSTASSSLLTAWALQESEDEENDDLDDEGGRDDLIFRLEM
uniref:Uncharacterized protein n=1 Tax=Hyaloperonospora arabidopsidis (strain Emoy2) TaxID=559515 RepID=M4B2Q4_HYAAE